MCDGDYMQRTLRKLGIFNSHQIRVAQKYTDMGFTHFINNDREVVAIKRLQVKGVMIQLSFLTGELYLKVSIYTGNDSIGMEKMEDFVDILSDYTRSNYTATSLDVSIEEIMSNLEAFISEWLVMHFEKDSV